MARAGPSRSQRTPQTFQSQPKGTRRGKRREDPEEEDEEDVQAENDDEGDRDVEMDGEASQGNKGDELTRKANNLVRLALFIEHRRMPLRRDDISKKVLGSSARSFNTVFELAQKILRKTFGMELVELRSRAEIHADGNANDNQDNKDDDLEEARKATGVKKKATAVGSKTYILRSVLHPLIIEYAALTDEQILEEEAADTLDDDDEDGFGLRTYGSIISWSNADQLGSIGVLYVVLTLILVSGRVMTDMDLRANLKRLRLPPTAVISFNAQSTHKQLTVDAFLSLLCRQGYIDRQRLGDSGKAAGGKRGRAPAATQANAEDGATYEWRWGIRAHSEVGEMGIGTFAAEFMVERMGVDEDEDEGGRGVAKGRRDEARKKVLEKMIKGIGRAAGGSLVEIK